MVLLKNDNVLPMKDKQVALFGAGARMTVRGGTGSGDMRERYSVNLEQGLMNAGFKITSTKWLNSYDNHYQNLYSEWKRTMEIKINKKSFFNVMAIFDVLGAHPFRFPVGERIKKEELDSESETAIYVVTRQAGEGSDRKLEKGDFILDDVEYDNIAYLAVNYKRLIVVINCGGMIDLSFMDEIQGIDALLYISQAGTEGGNAFADVITGKVSPSGKLTDTWAKEYEAYPSANTYSYRNGNLSVMSPYNRLNGVYVNNQYDLCTKVLRNEWGFDGIVMTDWYATGDDVGDNTKCAAAGNDLIMPGNGKARKQILQGIKNGTVKIEDIRRSASRVLKIISLSNVAEIN